MIPSLLYLLAVICSMMSQLPFLIGTTTGAILKLSWVLPFVVLFFLKPKDLFPSVLKPFFVLFILFAFYCFTMSTITGTEYVGSDLYNILLCLIITLISYVFWKNYASDKFLTVFGIALLFCAVVLAYVVYNTSFATYDILSRQYAYASKNSIGQILFASLLIGDVILLKKGKLLSAISIIISFFVFWVILVLKSRATFLSIFFVIAYFSLSYKNKHIRRIVVLLCAALAIWLISSPEKWDVFLNGIILAGRDASDINAIASGRLPLMAETWNNFCEHPIFGNGNAYMDCFPLIILSQYGIVGASIVFGIIIYAYKRVKRPSNDTISLLAFLLLVSFLINGLFEAQPPFGPGAKCFLVWAIFGYFMADNARKINV